MATVLRVAWDVLSLSKGCVTSGITRCTLRGRWSVLVAVLAVLVVACEPTGPTPIEYTVPTAVLETPTPRPPTATIEPTPTLTPTVTPTSPATPEPTPTELVTQAGWNVFALAPGGRVLTPTSGQDSVLWVAPAGPGLGLYLRDLRSGDVRRLAEPSVPGGCVCRGYREGDWVVMIDTEAGAAWWEVSVLNLTTDERTVVGRTEDPAVRDALRPGEMAVNAEGVVVWKDVSTEADGSVVQTLHLQDVVADQTREIVSVRSPVDIAQVAMYGDWVVWSQATAGEAGTRGDVFAYDIASDQLFPIGETGRAWEPAIWGTTVVWKHADGPFADGDVFLFDLGAGQGHLLTEGGQVSGVGVGDGFVAWASAEEGVVVRRDLETNTNDVIGRGLVGRLEAGGNTIVWMIDGDPNTLHVAWRR